MRNFPVLGRARYLLESIGPELRQYIVAGNNEERPFTRDQRRWVYASAKRENNYFGFGTDNDIEYTPGYPIIKHRTFGRAMPPSFPGAGHDVALPCAKVLGAARRRARAFRPESVVNISGMSFGSLSGNAVKALNRGAALAGCLHNTGEGGLSPYHRRGGDLVFQGPARAGGLRRRRQARAAGQRGGGVRPRCRHGERRPGAWPAGPWSRRTAADATQPRHPPRDLTRGGGCQKVLFGSYKCSRPGSVVTT
ncbi:glutamate synthase-related protein [Micromonospora sp. B11E3]|uniref:glutamate synthase-related protein n=1 Tax=Micromonospora sp. B11E3 TaxID=3153562 RepID=UPI00325CC671